LAPFNQGFYDISENFFGFVQKYFIFLFNLISDDIIFPLAHYSVFLSNIFLSLSGTQIQQLLEGA